MREIRFRALIKEDSKHFRMIYSPMVSTNDLADKSMPAFWSECEDYTVYKDDVILMQYTGLKDKNGKEIYEGDIIHAEGMDNPYYYEIKWIDEGFRMGRNFVIAAFTVEVIGNIYENPDLL